MTDTPAADAEPTPTTDRRRAVRWFAGWSEERRRNIFLIAYAVAFLVTAAAIWLVAVSPGALGLLLASFAGVFIAVGAGHLLPESQHRDPRRGPALVALSGLGAAIVLVIRAIGVQ